MLVDEIIRDETDLDARLKEAGMENVRVGLDKTSEQRLVSADQLERWFAPKLSSQGRMGYGQKLLEAGLSASELKQIAVLYGRSMLDQEVSWDVSTAYILAQAGT